MKKIHLGITVLANLAGFVVLYFYYKIFMGINYAGQSTFQTLSSFFAIEGLGLFGYIAYLILFKIPSEVFEEQKKIIDERLPEQLALTIEHTPSTMHSFNGNDRKVSALLITSKETKKIIEMRALVNFHHSYLPSGHESGRAVGYSQNAPLFWIAEDPPVTETELRPDIPRILLLCEVQKVLSGKREIRIASMGCDPTIDFTEESIISAKILFQGKVEGDYSFRTFHYRANIYVKPAEQRILFLEDAEKSYSDIPHKFLRRAKEVIKFLEAKNDV